MKTRILLLLLICFFFNTKAQDNIIKFVERSKNVFLVRFHSPFDIPCIYKFLKKNKFPHKKLKIKDDILNVLRDIVGDKEFNRDLYKKNKKKIFYHLLYLDGGGELKKEYYSISNDTIKINIPKLTPKRRSISDIISGVQTSTPTTEVIISGASFMPKENRYQFFNIPKKYKRKKIRVLVLFYGDKKYVCNLNMK